MGIRRQVASAAHGLRCARFGLHLIPHLVGEHRIELDAQLPGSLHQQLVLAPAIGERMADIEDDGAHGPHASTLTRPVS